LLLTDPVVRRAIVEPVRVVTGEGRRVHVPSFAAWWLADAPLFGDVTPSQSRLSIDERLAGLFDEVARPASGADDELLRAMGVHTTLGALLEQPHGADELLDRLADPDSDVTPQALQQIYRALTRLPEARWPSSPERVRVIEADSTTVVPASVVVVVVAPHHAPLVHGKAILGTTQVAEILDLDTTDSAASGVDLPDGVQRPMPAGVAELIPDAPKVYVEHEDIRCGGSPVDWWVTLDGEVHAATLDGLARGVAWSCDQWWRRWELAAVLAEPERLAAATAERAFDSPP
jgi:hypothetical protein